MTVLSFIYMGHKPFILFFLIGLTYSSRAQKLNLKTDKLTGDTIAFTSQETIYRKNSMSGTAGEILRLSVGRTGETYMLAASLISGKNGVFVIKAGSEINLKLASGRIVTLKNFKLSVSNYIFSSPGISLEGYYQLSPEDMDALRSSPVSYIRVNHDEGYFEYDIKEKYREVLRRCLNKF